MEDKFTVLQKAEKNVYSGQYRKAIEAYENLLRSEGEDPAILNTLGDLFLKVDQENEAIKRFDRVVELFSQSGFVNKAIGVCKKIHRIRPRDTHIIERLVDLYKKRGQEIEGAGYLRRLAGNYEEAGDLEGALRIQKRIVTDAPAESRGYLELGEVLEKLDRREEAVAQYLLAARMYLGEGYAREALNAASRVLQLDPDHIQGQEIRETAESKLAAPPPEETESGTADEREFAETTEEETGESEYAEESVDLSRAVSEGVDLDRLAGDEGFDDFDTIGDVDEGAEDHEFAGFGEKDDAGLESEAVEGFVPFDGPVEAEEIEGVDEPERAGEEPEPFQVETESWDQSLESGEFVEETLEPPELEEKEIGESEPVAFSFDDSELEVDSKKGESVESLLQEADFYLKLDLREDARRILRQLMEEHPGDQRILQRAREAGLEVPETSAEAGGNEENQEFSVELENALDGIFGESKEERSEESETLVYEIASDKEQTSDEPHSKYDLGLAYREMGMLEDAVDKFESAFRLAEDKDDTQQAILCCGMLSSTYLQLEDYEKALHWADRGLYFSPDRGFEKKALEYDRSRALEALDRRQESREGFERIVEEDPDFRDVQERLARLDSSAD